MQQGNLKVFVYSGNGLFPQRDSQVFIKKSGQLTDFAITDSAGQTGSFSFDTPDKSESLTPGYDKPYTELTVTVVKQGFYPETVSNVQIFSGVTSLLNAELMPIPEDSELTRTRTEFTSKPQFNI